MSRVLVYLGRFAVIILGYAAAALAASAFLHLLFLGPQNWAPEEVPIAITGSLLFSIPFVALFVAYFAFLPSLAVVLLAEILGRRDWLFYALAGIAIAAAVLGMLWLAAEPVPGGVAQGESTVRDPRFATLLAGGGIVGGLAYWLVAGRLAGHWRAKARPARTHERPSE